MRSLKLTTTGINGAEVWINPAHIVHWEADGGHTVIHLARKVLMVQEAPIEVSERFDRAVNEPVPRMLPRG